MPHHWCSRCRMPQLFQRNQRYSFLLQCSLSGARLFVARRRRLDETPAHSRRPRTFLCPLLDTATPADAPVSVASFPVAASLRGATHAVYPGASYSALLSPLLLLPLHLRRLVQSKTPAQTLAAAERCCCCSARLREPSNATPLPDTEAARLQSPGNYKR